MRRAIIGSGLGLMAFGVWVMMDVHAQSNGCVVYTSSGPASGLDSACVRTVMSYTQGFVFTASGLLVVAIGYFMINRHARLDLKSELRFVPRSFATPSRAIGLHSEIGPRSTARREPVLTAGR
jgi:hypothetical protein